MTLNDVKDDYLEYKQRSLAKSNFISHRSVLYKYILPYVGGKDVRDIDGKDVIKMMEASLSIRKSRLSNYVTYSVIKSVFKYLLSNNYIDKDITYKNCYYSIATGEINYKLVK